MGFQLSTLWRAPEINPVNKKARSIPILNPIDPYGRVLFFSWFSFMLAFWSWYAFPPLLPRVIAQEVGLTQDQVLNSNIIALVATLLVRLVAGPCCDRFGPRKTFAGTLLIGAIPTFLAGTVYNVHQLYAARFFIGILGGSFVPCQVWTTGFYDKNVIGTANSLTGGLGNSGGGVTYFVMPAIFNSLVENQGLTPDIAWRVSFVVPGIVITAAAGALLFFCQDCPTGKWSERHQIVEESLQARGVDTSKIVDVPGSVDDEKDKQSDAELSDSPSPPPEKKERPPVDNRGPFGHVEAQMGEQQMLDTAKGEVIQKPSFKTVMAVSFSPQVLVLGLCYVCSFGAELSVNAILGSYYSEQFDLSLQDSGNYAAIFGLTNIVWRPLGGVAADLAYRWTGGSVWAKKALLHGYILIGGGFLLAIGLVPGWSLGALVTLVGVAMAFFLAGANGLNFAVVPHVHPQSNGVVSGQVGAMGNLGGIIFAVVFRYTESYDQGLWILGAIMIALQVATCWIPPIPKGQVGGR